VLLSVVALLGFTMFAIWWRRQSRCAVREAVSPATPAEQHFPVAIVGLHGLLAVTTVVLVFLTAVGVGSS
jgi:manganese efflux pump family protein